MFKGRFCALNMYLHSCALIVRNSVTPIVKTIENKRKTMHDSIAAPVSLDTWT